MTRFLSLILYLLYHSPCGPKMVTGFGCATIEYPMPDWLTSTKRINHIINTWSIPHAYDHSRWTEPRLIWSAWLCAQTRNRVNLRFGNCHHKFSLIQSLNIKADPTLDEEGYVIRNSTHSGKRLLVITAKTEVGLLYGTFHFWDWSKPGNRCSR